MSSDKEARISHLKAMLAAREGKPEYSRNVEAIKAELQSLEASEAEGDDQNAA